MKKYTEKDKIEATSTLRKAAKLYDEFYCNKKLLVIYNNPSKPFFVEITASPTNFLHLTGLIINTDNLLRDVSDKNTNYKVVFYEKCLQNKLSIDDFDFDPKGDSERKLDVIISTLNPVQNAKMIGDYNGQRIYFQSNTLMGNPNSFLALFKDEGGYYVPSSVMKGDIRNDTYYTSRVLAILSKKFDEPFYNEIKYVAKKIDIGKLLEVLKNDVSLSPNLLSSAQPNAAAVNSSAVNEDLRKKLERRAEIIRSLENENNQQNTSASGPPQQDCPDDDEDMEW